MQKTKLFIAVTCALAFIPAIVASMEKAQPSTFQCERSHAGRFPGIKCEMTLSESGISWKFLESFKREAFVPWNAVDSWKAYGKTYGYTITINVTNPTEDGGSFRFSDTDRDAVISMFRRYSRGKEE